MFLALTSFGGVGGVGLGITSLLALLLSSRLSDGKKIPELPKFYSMAGSRLTPMEKKTGWVLPPDFKADMRIFQKILYNISLTDIFDSDTREILAQFKQYSERRLPVEYSMALKNLLALFQPLTITTDPELCEALNYPKARLHYGDGELRRHYDYDYTTARDTGGCFTFAQHGMFLKLKDFESVETFGTCIRLFNGPKCSQQSVAFFPSQKLHWSYFIFPWFPSGSIGPCTPQELLWTRQSEKLIGNVSVTLYDKEEYKEGLPYSPNVLNLLEFPAGDTSSEDQQSPVWLQTTGHSGTVLKLWAKFYKRHLRWNESLEVQPSEVARKILGSKEVREEDVLGYVIHPKLGGPGVSAFNLIPQTRWNWREWNSICTKFIYDYLTMSRGTEHVKLTLNFDYDQWNSSRPTGFSYWIEQNDSQINYGYLTNLK